MDLFPQLIEQARAFSWIDWTATITAILYVVLAARENNWCWFWGIISCSLWAYASFFFYDLWLDALLQLFYVAMAVVGLYQWRSGRGEEAVRPTTRMSAQEHLWCWLIIVPASLLFGYFFANYTPAAATYADAFTTVLSAVATIILVRKQLETWLYWLLADGLYVWLYGRQGAYLFALLMVIYVIIATAAYIRWQRHMNSVESIQG